ncbi:gluconate 2-dehydrogenase subunit 3 family protein [Peribacillus cavernae]|uniref:Gluconate 2-dehydrogenase subunit 3 family protein n=1 Tax=Peribacillus cavernae TaxID=1674310 RepID=A0A3S0VD14_9BACI|nr:gluconate 2-dehydrogenase subunit 3 family protein [Peribacillus cavernae]MDQ0221298.1 gluconate 2-dehydrogenase gamma chain [Peribacillus cavernae]RUQ29637.1 gluconate 2-dehydrogenase subunit 3 family protein [Peribacillus cavernae]
MSDKDRNQNEKAGNSRRTFLRNSGLTVGGLVLGGAVGSLFNVKSDSNAESADHKNMVSSSNPNQALMYFTPDQFKTVEALSETIFPKTESGPGAKELGVVYYIDHQLAGSWGLNTREYMTGPFYPAKAVPEQGYQTHLKRQQVFDIGIESINAYSTKKFKKKFQELEKEDDKIAILKDFEEDKVKLNSSLSSSFFFSILRSATIEGVYADPMYGGNKDMGGWKMKNFPGHQASFTNVLGKDKFVAMKPQSLNAQHKM